MSTRIDDLLALRSRVDAELARILTSHMHASERTRVLNAANGSRGPTRVLHLAAALHHLTPDDITGPRRTTDHINARHIAAWVLREHFGMSYPAIGHKLGGRDHTTAMNAVRRVNANPELLAIARKIALMASPEVAR